MSKPATPFDDIPGRLPEAQIPQDADYRSIANATLKKLNNLTKADLALFAIWRDILTFTDTFRTLYSADTVFDVLRRLRSEKQASEFSLVDGIEPKRKDLPNPPTSWLEYDVKFTTQDSKLIGQGAGIVSVMLDEDGEWKIWMLRTWLENYEGHGHPDRPAEASAMGKDNETIYDAAIVGGGQAGLSTAGRLHALGVRYILFDNRSAVGSIWKDRYEYLKWHTISHYGNLPFGRIFTDEDPMFLTGKRIAAAFKDWATKHSLNVRESTEITKATYDKSNCIWTVTGISQGDSLTWKAKTLVLAVGARVGSPSLPEWATPEKIKSSKFNGTVIHSKNYHSAKDYGWAKSAIVVGTANTGHDMAEDLANENIPVTMVQRNPTMVLPGEWLAAVHSRNYNSSKPTEMADREDTTEPVKISREASRRVFRMLTEQNKERFDALEKAGFKLDRYGDLFKNLFIRAGGHYIDTGATQRIIDGEIKVRSGNIKGLTPKGIEFEDGAELEADLIVLATGFNPNFRAEAAGIVGQEVADQMDEFSGTDPEGELRALGKYAGHPDLFYLGGDIRTARFYSRFVALQIQKRALGYPLRPFSEGREGGRAKI